MRATVLCTPLVALAACQPVDRRRSPPPPQASQAADTVTPAQLQAPPTTSSRATKVATVVGFLTPESVLDDSAQDIYFVSNIDRKSTRLNSSHSQISYAVFCLKKKKKKKKKHS